MTAPWGTALALGSLGVLGYTYFGYPLAVVALSRLRPMSVRRDPTWTPKTRDDEVLPFMPGVVRIASRAERIGLAVPIVPVGLEYRPGARWDLTVRFGEPYRAPVRGGEADLLAELEHDVRVLSGLPTRV